MNRHRDADPMQGNAMTMTELIWDKTEPFLQLLPAHNTAEQLVYALKAIGQTISTAESCTGGLVSAAITAVPGASEVFANGFITYCDSAKQRLLGVTKDTLEQFTAVSAETAAQMAYGCAHCGQADLSLAVTGLAGPGGGSDEKPVGLVYIGCCYHQRVYVQEYHFQGDREEIRRQAVMAALQLGFYCLRIR